MATAKYDAFIARVLRQVRVEFAFITPDYPHELPVDFGLGIGERPDGREVTSSEKEAAQIVHDFLRATGKRYSRES